LAHPTRRVTILSDTALEDGEWGLGRALLYGETRAQVYTHCIGCVSESFERSTGYHVSGMHFIHVRYIDNVSKTKEHHWS
jgi:hypothetical protein